MQQHDSSERFREHVGGRTVDGDEAVTGTPVMTVDGKYAGKVSGVEGKYVRVEAPDGEGDDFWLSSASILRADREAVVLNFEAQALGDFAMARPGDGADAADPRINEQADALGSDAEKERRREGLVRE
jgi:hypothetical protein